MNTNQSGRAIRLLGTLIRITRTLLLIISGLVVILTALAVSGNGTMTVAARLDQQYVVDFGEGRRISVGGDVRSFENFDIGKEHAVDVDHVALTVTVDKADRDSRLVLAAMFLGWLGAAWIILLNLERLVASASAGNAFSDDSPKWLRSIGMATLGGAVLTVIGRLIIESTLEADVPVDLAIGGAPIWIPLVFGLGMFALAEIFGEAVRLREFEESTV